MAHDRRDPRRVQAAIAAAASPVDRAAIKLREAAISFTNAPFDESDLHDRLYALTRHASREGYWRNKALLAAALSYAKAHEAAEVAK